MQPATLADGPGRHAYTSTALIADGATGPYTWRATGLPAGLEPHDRAGCSPARRPRRGRASSRSPPPMRPGWPPRSTARSRSTRPRASPRPPSLPSGQVGAAYATTTVTASGGTTPYTFSATGLPAGPHHLVGRRHQRHAHHRGFQPPSACGSRMRSAPSPPASYQVSVIAGVAIASPASLPDGTVGTAYATTTVTASGGTAPYAFSATGLPAGLDHLGGRRHQRHPHHGRHVRGHRAGDRRRRGDRRRATTASSSQRHPSRRAAIPFAPANGFQVFVEGSTNLATWDIWGAVATGGDLTFKNYQRIATHETSTLTVHTGGSRSACWSAARSTSPRRAAATSSPSATGWFALGSATVPVVPHVQLRAAPRAAGRDRRVDDAAAGRRGRPGRVGTANPVNADAFDFDDRVRDAAPELRAILGPLADLVPSISMPTVSQAYGNHTLTLVAERGERVEPDDRRHASDQQPRRTDRAGRCDRPDHQHHRLGCGHPARALLAGLRQPGPARAR